MSDLKVVRLSCEYKENPLGIDVKRPRLSWQIESDRRGVMQSAYQIQVSQSDSTFNEIVWDSGVVKSDQSIHVEYAGDPLLSRTRYYYRVRVWDNQENVSSWSETAYWETGLLDSGEWVAEWITTEQEEEASSLLRKVFNTSGLIEEARIYATSLGLYELYLNGKKVSDWLFTPGWTSYNKRLQYQTYDVTELLNEGENVVGALLGDGWYKGYIGWESQKEKYGNKRALLMQLHIKYRNGKEEVFVTDESWKANTGPIQYSQIYHGEIYDARLEKEDWCSAGYDDKDWKPVVKHTHTKDTLVAQENDPTRVIETLKPLQVIRTPAGETVIDFGQNLVGWVHFSVTADAGTEIVLQHAEVLDKDGNFYTDNLRSAKQTIRYTCKGEGVEEYEPHFTFQGFRYVKVEGYPGEIPLDKFKAKVIHTDMKPTGHFECSDELINQLQHNIVWGQKGNFLDVPTDCPQRDERLGWTGDAQVFIRTAIFNMNVAPFFTKWLRDLKADQLKSGGVPFVIPNVLEDFAGDDISKSNHSSAAWGDAAVICPWTLYLCYGDKRILEEQYDSMKAWVEYIRAQGDNEYLWNTGFHFGDWLALDAKEGSYFGATPNDLVATAFYANSADLLARTADVLGKVDDAKKYRELHQEVVTNFNQEFVTPNGRLVAQTQTAHVLALMFDLVGGDIKKRIAESLVRLIEEHDYHLTTGFVGTPYLCLVLSENGYDDVAYKLLLQKDYPSWLYQITKGATTVWEHWDGIKEDGSFWSEDMNSFNHYAYGSVGDWLYRVVAGIDTDEQSPAYKHMIIHPRLNREISYVKASFHSMYGEVRSEWYKENKNMKIKVQIPCNTTATVVLPLAKVEEVKENGIQLNHLDDKLTYRQLEEGTQLELSSGTYLFNYSVKE